MRPRFLADADLNQKIVHGLRRREPAIDFQSAQEGGTIGVQDPGVLQMAATAGRILVSHDKGTMLRHFEEFVSTRSSPGLIVVSQELPIGDAIEELLLIWATTEAEEWRDQVAFIPI